MKQKQRKKSTGLSIVVILMLLMMQGCAGKSKEFVMTASIDRQWVDKNQVITAPTDGVFLSNRAFKHYSKGCDV